LERFGSFRIGMTALVAVGLITAGGAAHPAAAAPEDPGLVELWEQFPLDAERNVPARRERSSDDARTRAEPAQRVAPKSVPRPGGADSTFGTPAQFAIVAAGIALLLGGFAVLYTGHPPRPPRLRMPAGSFAHGRRQAQAAAGVAADWVRTVHAALPMFRSAAIPATYPPLTGRRVLDDLLRVVSAGTPKRKPREAKMLRMPGRPGHAPEMEALKTKPRVAEALKNSRALPLAEAEVLKRKPLVDATEVLKAKRERERALDKERFARSDAVALKEKLASTVEPEHATKRREYPARNTRPRRAGPKRPSALRPVSDPGVVETPTEARQTRLTGNRTQECEVRWWRGYVKSQFFAVATDAGADVTVAVSPSFRWRKGKPPPETPEAAAALRALVGSLEHKGWKVVGRGEEWFAVRLAAARTVDCGGIDVPQSRT
jgi:hypothetical protein